MDENNYYILNRGRFFQLAQAFFGEAKKILSQRYKKGLAQDIYYDSLEKYEKMLKGLPDIGGGENPLTENLTGAALGLALYLSMKARGKNADEIGRINYDLVEKLYSSEYAGRPVGESQADRIERHRESVRNCALRSQKREFEGDWVSESIDCNGAEFDYGWNNVECGIKKLFEKYDAREYLPYQCILDKIIYSSRKLGLTRTKTLVDDECCDFRIKLEGEVRLLDSFSKQKLSEWGK
jgi:hypothetical protein